MITSFLSRPLPAGLEGLADLATDLRWTSSQATDSIWQRLDAEAWERTNNPYMILQNVAQERLEEAARDEHLKEALADVLAERVEYAANPGWFTENHGGSVLRNIAYFSMEFGLSEALPIYSGGLGILAGDHLKAASDLGVPVTGIGLLYQQGYFRQILAADCSQLEAFPYNDPSSLPVTPVTDENGRWLRLELMLPGRSISVRVWQVRVGRVRLLLLDSNDPLNNPWDRAITDALYGVGTEKRLIQEIVLGFGGWRAIRAVGIDPEVIHINEGHAAFAVLARAREFMERNNLTFSEALWATRAGNVFTTHTPVAAGFDRFDSGLMRKYAGIYADQVGVSVETLLDLGRERPGDPSDGVCMANLAIRGGGFVNGVSELHGRVSRRIFLPVFPGRPEAEVPVTHVTNGVHVPSWDSPAAHSLWVRACGKRGQVGDHSEGLETDRVTDEELWNHRGAARAELVGYVRRRLVRQVQAQGATPEAVQRAGAVLDPNALTLGFARRFAPYKRPGLLLSNPERLMRLLCDPHRPVQLIIAGKAHPNDGEGKKLVQRLARFASDPRLAGRIVFLADYDMALSQQLAAGVDVWINNPRRPWEACGTSGMKLLVNGGLNLSILDGWWAEGYTPEVGWALGSGEECEGDEWDAREAEDLYRTLETRIIPEFYDRDERHIPDCWIARVRGSMARLTPQFSAGRMVRDYAEKAYLPAAAAYLRRTANGAATARDLDRWRHRIARGWGGVRVAACRVQQAGAEWRFRADVYLGEVPAEDLRVELYCEPRSADEPSVRPMVREGALPGIANGHVYATGAPSDRPAEHYTVRVTPWHPEASLPLEDSRVIWER